MSLEREARQYPTVTEVQAPASEHDMYMHGYGKQRLILGVYVDDLIITGGDMEVLGRFKREMSNNFKMSDLDVLSYYLGIEVQ